MMWSCFQSQRPKGKGTSSHSDSRSLPVSFPVFFHAPNPPSTHRPTNREEKKKPVMSTNNTPSPSADRPSQQPDRADGFDDDYVFPRHYLPEVMQGTDNSMRVCVCVYLYIYIHMDWIAKRVDD